jgi:hypothetical protein
MPDPAQQGYVDWNTINAALRARMAVDEHVNQQKIQAIQWQGQQDYQTLTDSGVDPAEALRRSAPKLFFNDPVGLAHAVGALKEHASRPTSESIQPVIKTLDDGTTKAFWTGSSWQRIPSQREFQDPTAFVDVTTKDANGQTIRRRIPTEQQAAEARSQERTDAQAALDAAKSAMPSNPFSRGLNWIKGDPAGQALASASNAVANLNAPAPGQPAAPSAPPASTPPASPSTGSGATNEVIRKTKDGRRAVFDAATKKFIRYADDAAEKFQQMTPSSSSGIRG